MDAITKVVKANCVRQPERKLAQMMLQPGLYHRTLICEGITMSTLSHTCHNFDMHLHVVTPSQILQPFPRCFSS